MDLWWFIVKRDFRYSHSAVHFDDYFDELLMLAFAVRNFNWRDKLCRLVPRECSFNPKISYWPGKSQISRVDSS
ncbi:hypothetical protein QYF36_009394 [Acer negundo]|nr:hypothetical protein QYF36_009394 [Acer negundo]